MRTSSKCSLGLYPTIEESRQAECERTQLGWSRVLEDTSAKREKGEGKVIDKTTTRSGERRIDCLRRSIMLKRIPVEAGKIKPIRHRLLKKKEGRIKHMKG